VEEVKHNAGSGKDAAGIARADEELELGDDGAGVEAETGTGTVIDDAV
jgi:hypothetical protein